MATDLLLALVAEATSIADAAKLATGHQDHDGLRTEDGFQQFYCGCGQLLIDIRQADVARVRHPATATVTFEVVTR